MLLGCRIIFFFVFIIFITENSALQYLVNQHGSKIRIKYSIFIGNERDIERSLSLRVPTNTSFYGIMEISADIDSRYK